MLWLFFIIEEVYPSLYDNFTLYMCLILSGRVVASVGVMSTATNMKLVNKQFVLSASPPKVKININVVLQNDDGAFVVQLLHFQSNRFDLRLGVANRRFSTYYSIFGITED